MDEMSEATPYHDAESQLPSTFQKSKDSYLANLKLALPPLDSLSEWDRRAGSLKEAGVVQDERTPFGSVCSFICSATTISLVTTTWPGVLCGPFCRLILLHRSCLFAFDSSSTIASAGRVRGRTHGSHVRAILINTFGTLR
jgi:hypothetical protein